LHQKIRPIIKKSH